MTTELKDSGTRTNFSTGAVRDGAEGKGRFDLVAAEALISVGEYYDADAFVENVPGFGPKERIARALKNGWYYLAGYRNTYQLEAIVWDLLVAYQQNLDKDWVPPGPGVAALPFDALQAVALVYELGAKKYAARNWEKGIDTYRYLDSGLRHIYKYLAGWTDEPHLAMGIWNFLCLLQTEMWLEAGKLPPALQTLPSLKEFVEL